MSTINSTSREEQSSQVRLNPVEAISATDDRGLLRMYLRALRSYFNIRNYPASEIELADILVRDWSQDLRIAADTVLLCTRYALAQIEEQTTVDTESLGSEGESFADWVDDEDIWSGELAERNVAACELAEMLCGVQTTLENEERGEKVSLYSFTGFRSIIERGLANPSTQSLIGDDEKAAVPAFAAAWQNTVWPEPISERDIDDILRIITGLYALLDYLKVIELALEQDRPLQQTLPMFCLIHEDARIVLGMIEGFGARIEHSNEDLFNLLDATKFAVTMELRKVFSFELVGLVTMRQAPSIFARVENAHGLLRDSFQQSILGLAQVFDPTVQGSALFGAFRTRLEQSLELRSDIWTLLQRVRQAEIERDKFPIARLVDRLNSFRSTSLRFLMFKDWEACERFIEEVDAARGAVELSPVLNRFSAFLETLHGQVNMRSVLAEHPFDYPQLDE